MTNFQRLQRRIGGFPIEYPAAALMAGAVALCTLALPDWRFEAAINATGLPGLLSAAAPPLGTTARVLAALGLGALAFLLVWFVLRGLDAKPQSTDFPAFRAADLHPDAPRRRPILAGAEFGAPAGELPSIEEQLGRRRPIITEPLPSFLAPQATGLAPEARAPETRRPVLMPAPVEEPEPAESVESSPPVPVPAPAAEIAPAQSVDARRLSGSAQTGEPAEAASPSSPAVLPGDHDEEEESVGELMERLESGLSRRASRPVPGPSGSAQDELRRALGDLNRVSGRG